MMSRLLEEYKDIYSDFLERCRSGIVDGYWHLKENRNKFPTKEEDFKHIQNIAEAVLDALEILINTVEGERQKPGIQPYINQVLSTINIHLERIKNYYPKNNPKGFKTKESKREETKFQGLVFKGEQKIKSKLRSLNIENNMDHVVIEFFDDKKATLPMMEVLCDLVPTVRAKVESLDIDWDLKLDNGMFINMPKRDIPDYNSEKHFWDQEKEVLEFYISEWNKIKHGLDIDGYFLHGWLYFHLNYFKTPIGNEGDKIMNPPLRDNEWYWHEILKDAEKRASNMEDAGVFIFGTRRFAKSSCEASMSFYKILTSPTKNGTLTATNEKDILSITDKVSIGLEYVHPAFFIHTTSKDWKSQVKFGMKSKSHREYKLFYLDIINTDSGSKRGGQKTAGGAPVLFVMDEAGKQNFLKSYNAAIPSFETATGWKCIPFFVGTGGEEDLSQEAEKVLSNPNVFRFIDMDWDLLEWQVPKEAITWKRRTFGWFIPAQMGYKKGFKRIERDFSDFLGIESEELSKIKILQTDWINNTRVCREAREKLKNDQVQLQQETVFYPLDPEECFMSAKTNPYPADKAKKHKQRLISEYGEYGSGRPVELYRDTDNPTIVKYTISDKELATFPHPGGFVDAPFLLFGSFPQEKPPMYRYVAGCLTPGEQVKTDKGLMNVEEINLQNKLINKEGLEVNIIALQKHFKKNENIYKIKVGNTYRTTTFTQEHPIYICRPDFYTKGKSKGRVKSFNFDNPYFSKTSELKKGDWIKYPNIYRSLNNFDINNLWEDFNLSNYCNIIDSPLFNEFFWYFIGVYLGDGWLENYKNLKKIGLVFHKNEVKSLKNCIYVIENIFKSKIYKKTIGNKTEITFTHTQLWNFINKHFGQKSDGKKIPEWAKKIEQKYKLALICGYLNSDGCVMNDRKSKRILTKFVSINLEMLEGFQDIIFSLNVKSYLSLLRREGVHKFPNGKISKTKKTFMLVLNQRDSIKLIDMFDEKFIMKKYNKKIEVQERRGKNCIISDCGNYIYFKIINISKDIYTGFVYNFECETNTFLTPHITTHNCDDYKHEDSDGDSVGAFYIFDRLTRKIVLSLATRPDPHSDLHVQIHMALDAYNAICFPENEDMDIKKYFDRIHLADLYLGKGFDVMSQFNLATTGKRKYGWQPDRFTAPFVRGLTIDYSKEKSDILDDNDNVIGTNFGLERIEDIYLLEEIIKYKEGGNFDRLVAFGSCLLYDHYLTAKYIVPSLDKPKKDPCEQRREKKPLKNKYFSNNKRRLWK